MAKWKDEILKNQFGIPVAAVHYVPWCIFFDIQLYKTTYEMINRSYPNRYRKKTFQKYHRKYYDKLMDTRQQIESDGGATFRVESSKSSVKNLTKYLLTWLRRMKKNKYTVTWDEYMTEIELVRRSSDMFVYIPENFETIINICVEKLKKEKYHTLRIYRKDNIYEMHNDLAHRMKREIILWYKKNLSIHSRSLIMFNFHRMMINRKIAAVQTSVTLWMIYFIMSLSVPSENILQYTHCKEYMYLDLKGLPALIKPMKPALTYRMLNGSSKYIHHPMKLDISSIYGEMKR